MIGGDISGIDIDAAIAEFEKDTDPGSRWIRRPVDS